MKKFSEEPLKEFLKESLQYLKKIGEISEKAHELSKKYSAEISEDTL